MSGNHAMYPLQTNFWKSFGRYGIFLGTVVGYSSDGLYKCYYEGDGDEENLTEEEIESWLKRYPSVAKINQDAAKKKMTQEHPNKDRARNSTPEKKQSKNSSPKALGGKKEQLDAIWKQNLQKLKAFRKAKGHTRVPKGWPQDPSLAIWVKTQRQNYKKGTIQPHRQALLEKEGFEFCPLERSWDESYQLLVDHKKKFGGFSNVTLEGPHKNLFHWMKHQKSKHWEGRLPSDRKKLLDGLGLDFEKQSRTFEDNFHLLLEFQKIHGHTNVPRQYQDQKLASFIFNKRNRIPQDQRDELENIGFQFRLLEKPRTFEENYELLLEFKEESGHVSVPRSWDKALGNWVSGIRCGHTKLNETQKKKLSGIGFEWHRNRTWQESFDALLTYKKKHGNCDVPSNYKKDTPLGDWVYRHKKSKRYNTLSPEQKGQLEAIGFCLKVDGEAVSTSSLESNVAGLPVSKSKKHKAATNTRSNQAMFQKTNQATKSTRAAKQRARWKIEKQVDQESSNDVSASDSYDSDESSASEESIPTTHDKTACLKSNCSEEAISSQSKDGQPGSEVSSDKAKSFRPRALSTGSARFQGKDASDMAPDLPLSASAKMSTGEMRTGRTHRQTRAKAAAQEAVPDTVKSEPHSKNIVPDPAASSSAPPARHQPRRCRRKRQEEKPESNKKPRWLFA